MAIDKTTSQETDGTDSTKNDFIRIARSGSNYKLSTIQLGYQQVTKSALTSLISSSSLIPSKVYKITDDTTFIIGSSATIVTYVKAVDVNRLDPVRLHTPDGTVWYRIYCNATGTIARVEDSYGNIYNKHYGVGGFVSQKHYTSGGASSTTFSNNLSQSNFDFAGALPSSFIKSNVDSIQYTTCDSSSSMTVTSSKIKGGVISVNQPNSNVFITNCELTNVQIVVPYEGTSTSYTYNLSGCVMNDCIIELRKGVIVNNLTIVGKYSNLIGQYARFYFDKTHTDAGRVQNNYSGYIYCDEEVGYSTVKARLSFATAIGTPYTWTSTKIQLEAYSPIGHLQLVNNNTGSNYLLDQILSADYNYFCSLKIQPHIPGSSTWQWTFQTSNPVQPGQIKSFHAVGTKVRELTSPECFIDVKQKWNGGTFTWRLLQSSAHYD